jgi:hypothetical protein
MLPSPRTIAVAHLEYQEMLRFAAKERLAAGARQSALSSLTRPRQGRRATAMWSSVRRIFVALMQRNRSAQTLAWDESLVARVP